ncbi:MAG: hypothetical protein ABDH28_01835 [Brevinematia bacterium]
MSFQRGVIAILILVLTSCGIDVPELVVTLRPPMGLKVWFTTNDTIKLEFWGFNDEDYFSGYVVFASSSYSEIADTTKSLGEKPKIPNMETRALPTFSVLPTSEPTNYVFELPLTVQSESGNIVFIKGFQYYIAVAGYSASKKIYSPLSNITNVVLTN